MNKTCWPMNSTFPLNCVDVGSQWMFRDPPWGAQTTPGRPGYEMCSRILAGVPCHLGDQCSHAHSSEELDEWRRRYEVKQKESEAQIADGSYTNRILQQMSQVENVDEFLRKQLDYARILPLAESVVVSKDSPHVWTVTVVSKVAVHWIALLDNECRAEFSIVHISSLFDSFSRHREHSVQHQCQEWKNPYAMQQPHPSHDVVYCVKVLFSSCVYGTFSQKLVFDFDQRPILVQFFRAEVVPDPSFVLDAEKEDSLICTNTCWNTFNANIIPFHPPVQQLTPKDIQLLVLYPPPRGPIMADVPALTKPLSIETYRQRFHLLLLAEEWSQRELLSKYNIETELQLAESYWLTGMINTAKFCIQGELFAQLKLHRRLTEDTAAGRIILSGCNSVLISPKQKQNGSDEKPKVHEAVIEGKCKDTIYLRLSTACVSELNLKASEVLVAEVQFQLDRLPICELHHAVESLPNTSLVFPSIHVNTSIPWSPQKQWCNIDHRLNVKQREAIVAMMASSKLQLPPILLVGPYGTGKTFTLAQGIKHLLEDVPESRILICTHSNSAADLYVKDYLHKYVESGLEAARPLRVFYRLRRVETVHPTVLQYSLFSAEGCNRGFRDPTSEEIQKYRVVVVTLATSRILTELDLPMGHFTHMVLDEAAQVMECEAILPFALFNGNTRVILAGDHMQLSPEVHSNVAHANGLQISLLERLYDLYPPNSPCTILLCENYRSHQAIVKFTSKLFYQDQLQATSHPTVHPTLHPLSFFAAKGEEVQDSNSTAYYNNAEVYEVVERVSYLVKSWPKVWGTMDGNSVGVVTPYADQVFQLRSALRQKKLGYINVERVLNIQGKQFRVIVLSTVRTRHTCCGKEDKFYKNRDDSVEDDEQDFGFLSNMKLLITAMTRAQSLVAVVGDPIALCSIGKCRKLWECYLETCDKSGSLVGTSLNKVRIELENLEVGISSVLNPRAPIFVPRHVPTGLPYHHHPHHHHLQLIRPSHSNLIPLPITMPPIASRYRFAMSEGPFSAGVMQPPSSSASAPSCSSERPKSLLCNGLNHLLVQQNGDMKENHHGQTQERFSLDLENLLRSENVGGGGGGVGLAQQHRIHPQHFLHNVVAPPLGGGNLSALSQAQVLNLRARHMVASDMSDVVLQHQLPYHPAAALLHMSNGRTTADMRARFVDDTKMQAAAGADPRETSAAALCILQHNFSNVSVGDALHLHMGGVQHGTLDDQVVASRHQNHHQQRLARSASPDSSQHCQISCLAAAATMRGLAGRPSSAVSSSVLDEFEQRVAPRANREYKYF